jgi:hypothetical protein
VNREDIIRMAREAAMVRKEGQWGVYYHEVGIPDLMRFAALVAAAERDANLQQIDIIVEAEREACAMVCANMRFDNIEKDWSVGAAFCAEAIRARGEK